MNKMKKIATREAYGNALTRLCAENENIVVLDADLSGSTKSGAMKKVAPERHFNAGIAECNMMGMAAGLAASGNTVFASSFAMFATGRAYEVIRNSIGYPNLNVKICASHSGITVGEDGASHQTIEDIALMSVIPNMTVIQPCDAVSTEALIDEVVKVNGPCYVRLGRLAVEGFYEEGCKDFKIGKGIVLNQGEKIAVVATGYMVQQSMQALELLKAEGINPTIVDMHTIKPIDEELLVELAKTHDVILTVEEHSVIGGLGSMVASTLAPYNLCKVVLHGLEDTFGESGSPADLLKKYKLDAAGIAEKIKTL